MQFLITATYFTQFIVIATLHAVANNRYILLAFVTCNHAIVHLIKAPLGSTFKFDQALFTTVQTL